MFQLSENARQAAMRIAGVVTYHQFKRTVGDAVGNEIGWNQVSALFNITKRAIQVAGASGALAVQIKEMSLRYFEDKFAGWIVGQGGWVSNVPLIVWLSIDDRNLSLHVNIKILLFHSTCAELFVTFLYLLHTKIKWNI